jgi:hypothetical protein
LLRNGWGKEIEEERLEGGRFKRMLGELIEEECPGGDWLRRNC